MFQSNLVRSAFRSLAGPVLFMSIGAGSISAQLMFRVPGDSPGIPAYARVERPFLLHTDEWAAIVFYRDPGCVPATFNLLDLFDFPSPSNPQGAFGCALTVSGFELWTNGPAVDAGPRHAISTGVSVPIWFVSWPVLQAAIGDNVLTKTELVSLGPLRGTAKIFHEILNPFVPEVFTGGAKVPHLNITASGVLEDGRSFQFLYNDVIKKDPLVEVKIVFR